MLPLSPGRAESHGFEYKRSGTLSLFAALDSATGEVLGKTAARHTSAQFVAFLADVVSSEFLVAVCPRLRNALHGCPLAGMDLSRRAVTWQFAIDSFCLTSRQSRSPITLPILCSLMLMRAQRGSSTSTRKRVGVLRVARPG